MIQKPIDINFWLGIIFLAVFGTAVQYISYQKSIQQIGKSATVIFFYLQPVFVVILSALFLSEEVNWQHYLLGLLFVLLGSSLNISLVRQKLKKAFA